MISEKPTDRPVLALPRVRGQLAFVAVFVVAFGVACPAAEDPRGGADRPDVGTDVGSDTGVVCEPDAANCDGPEVLEVQVTRIAHPAMPQGWSSGDNSWTIVAEPRGERWETEAELAPGILYMSLSPSGEPSAGEQIFRPLAGEHDRQLWERSLFLVPTVEEVRLTIDGDDIIIERLDADSPGHHVDAAVEALARGDDDPLEVMLAMQSALREGGGAPLEAADLGLFFLAIGSEDGVAPDIRGTFNDWSAGSAYELRPIKGRLWGRFVLGIEDHHAYKLTYGGGQTWYTDFANPHIDWDGIATDGLGSFNSIINPQDRPAGTGRLVWLPRVASPQLGNTREVYVYLPESYDSADGASSGDHPLLIVHDGNESIGRGQFHHVAGAHPDAPVIAFVALADQEDRMAEYTVATEGSRGHLYGEFIVETLVPKLSERFDITSKRSRRGLAGASLGGLISFWVGAQYPNAFGFVGGMSSSFFWADEHILELIDDLGCQEISYYLDSGSPQDNYEVTLKMRDLLDELGCNHTHFVDHGGLHEWSYWNARFGQVLDGFVE